MRFFFAIVFAAVLCAEAAPYPRYFKHATHRERQIGHWSCTCYHPLSKLETYGEGEPMANALSFDDEGGLKNNTMAWMQRKLNSYTMTWRSGSTKNDHGISTGYVEQTYNNIPFANAVANVAFSNNNAISFGNSFVETTKMANSTPQVSVADAIRAAEATIDGQHNGIPTLLQYLARPDGSASLVRAIQIQNEVDGTFLEVYVDAHSGEVISMYDFVAAASFVVLPIGKQSLTDGLELVKDPEGLDASLIGWNNAGTTPVTSGNNAVVVDGKDREPTVGTGSGGQLTFDFTYDQTKDPTDANNLNAARVNGFFIANEMHDIMYRYGFTEKAFNFQSATFGKGGDGQDPVLMFVQDPSGTNNANFGAPPDGQPGESRIFIFDTLSPRQDGALENDILNHELTHGVTARMIGGGTSRCLQSLESGGMGEGWSDAVANWMTQKSTTTADFVLGQFVTGNNGFRAQPYSVNPNVNTHKYSDIAKLNEVHDIGEVWANTLHNVYADLVTSLGFSNTAKTDSSGKEGNVVYMNLLITALTIQPCNPTVLAARDAIIQADRTLYNGANECTLRRSFAKKGLGLNATPDFKDDDSIPANCI